MRLLANIFIGCLALSLTSCSSDELTREEAQKLIEDFYQYPNVELAEFSLDVPFIDMNEYGILVDNGCLTYSQYSDNLGVTEKGRLYQGPTKREVTFVTNLRFFKEITGIRYENEDKTKAVVEFSVERRNVTPFGDLKGYGEGGVVPYSLTCQRYDDGWRAITKKKDGNITPKDFPGIEEFQQIEN